MLYSWVEHQINDGTDTQKYDLMYFNYFVFKIAVQYLTNLKLYYTSDTIQQKTCILYFSDNESGNSA